MLERRIQGLANAAFLRVHAAAAKAAEAPLDLVAPVEPLDLVEQVDLVQPVAPPTETPEAKAARARSRVAERLARTRR